MNDIPITNLDILLKMEPIKKVFRPVNSLILNQLYKDYNLIDKRVLDIGAGLGEISKLVSSYQNNLIQYDRDFNVLQKNKYDNFGSKIILGDINQFSFKNEQFNAVIGLNVLDIVSDLESSLNSIYNILKKEGVLIHLMSDQAASDILADKYINEGYTVFPYPFFIPETDEFYSTSMLMVKNEDMMVLKKDKGLNNSIKRWLDIYLEEPSRAFYITFHNWKNYHVVIDYMEQIKKTKIDFQIVNYNDGFQELLAQAVKKSSFEVIESGIRTNDIDYNMINFFQKDHPELTGMLTAVYNYNGFGFNQIHNNVGFTEFNCNPQKADGYNSLINIKSSISTFTVKKG